MSDDDSLSDLTQSLNLNGKPVNIRSRSGKNVALICTPIDAAGEKWEALSPKNFEAKYGKIYQHDLDHLLVLVKEHNRDNFVPSVLYDQAVRREDGTPTKSGEKWEEATRTLRDLGIPIKSKPERTQQGTWEKDGQTLPKYKLEGERQFFQTPGGIRVQAYDYKNRVSTGAAAPDIHLHNGKDNDYQGILVFRKPNDSNKDIAAFKNAHNFTQAALKSASNHWHDEAYIDSRSKEWNTASHRFKGYLNEGHISGLSGVMVDVNGRTFPAEMILQHKPDSPHAQKLLHGPSAETDHIQIYLKDFRNNGFQPIELASVYEEGHLAKVTESLNIHKGAWAETETNEFGEKKLTKKANSELFSRYANTPNVRVQMGNVLYALDDEKITTFGEDFRAAHPRNKIFVTTVGDNGGRNGTFRNAASLTNDRIPQEAMEELTVRMNGGTQSRFAPSALQTEAQQRNGAAYQTPAATPAASRFAHHNVTPVAPLQYGAQAGQQPSTNYAFNNMTPEHFSQNNARNEISSRPSSRASNTSMGDL